MASEETTLEPIGCGGVFSNTYIFSEPQEEPTLYETWMSEPMRDEP